MASEVPLSSRLQDEVRGAIEDRFSGLRERNVSAMRRLPNGALAEILHGWKNFRK